MKTNCVGPTTLMELWRGQSNTKVHVPHFQLHFKIKLGLEHCKELKERDLTTLSYLT